MKDDLKPKIIFESWESVNDILVDEIELYIGYIHDKRKIRDEKMKNAKT